jgi:protein TonB
MNVPVLVKPQFTGGDTALAAFLKKNLVYPAAEKAAGKSGTVIISFVVEADGTISFPEAVTEVEGAPDLTQEAMRLVKLMPKWQAGKSNGIPTRMFVKLPVEFKL